MESDKSTMSCDPVCSQKPQGQGQSSIQGQYSSDGSLLQQHQCSTQGQCSVQGQCSGQGQCSSAGQSSAHRYNNSAQHDRSHSLNHGPLSPSQCDTGELRDCLQVHTQLQGHMPNVEDTQLENAGRQSRWRTVQRHLWDPTRLRRACDFATNMSQSVSASSPPPEPVTNQPQIELTDSAVSMQAETSAASVVKTSGCHANKSTCLRLIDRIWKGGLEGQRSVTHCDSQGRNVVLDRGSRPEAMQLDESCDLLHNVQECLLESPQCIISHGPEDIRYDRSGSANCSETDAGEPSGSSSKISLSSTPPFKKARYSWQVKTSTRERSPSGMDTSEEGATLLSSNETDTTNSATDISSCESSFVDCDTEMSSNPPRQRSSNVYPCNAIELRTDEDFHQLSEALTHLNYADRWQCQHVAKSIVDNAINKTLEEMGLSPADNGTIYREQRARIENAGVSQAIMSRGLRRYSPTSYRMRRINPIINRLTRVSEDLFSENLQSAHRNIVPDQPNISRMNIPNVMEVFINFDESSESSDSDDASLILPVSLSAKLLRPALNSEDWSNRIIQTSGTLQENVVERLHTQSILTHEADLERQSTPNDIQEDDLEVKVVGEVPNSKFVLDHAVDTVICERGLHFQELT